jgi:hypothetical protein
VEVSVKVLSSGVLQRVVWWMFTDILEECTVFIFGVVDQPCSCERQ